MLSRTVRAHFDGEHIRLDEPCILEPETPLLVIVLPQQHDERTCRLVTALPTDISKRVWCRRA